MANAPVVQKSMDFLSKKMGVAGGFLGYVFYISMAPELLRIKLAIAIAVLYIVATKIGDCIDLFKNPASFTKHGFMARMSKTLTVTAGFNAGLVAANFSDDLKLWAGFCVTAAYLAMVGIYDGCRAYKGISKENRFVEVSTHN